MRILAIDPGSHLGWATDTTGRLEWGTEDFTIKRGESSGNRWRRFGEWLLSASRTLQMNVPGEKRWAYDPVDLIVYEVAHFMPKARAAAEIAAGFTTRLEEHAERHGIALHPVPVQTLKAFAIPAPKRPKRFKSETKEQYRKRCPPHDRSKDAMIRAAWHKLTASYDQGIHGPCARCGMPYVLNEAHVCPKGKAFAELTEHAADALWLYWYAKEVLAA